MRLKCIFLLLLAAFGLPSALVLAEPSAKPLVIHEWGTFTSLQNELGEAIGGINTDDEPVPRFVHRLADFLLLIPTEVPTAFFQGAPHCHPDVTMRLETPVLYFHPPVDEPNFKGINVSATFRGGWLSEFYPDAEANAPGVKSNGMVFGPLRSSTTSTLTWNNLEVGDGWPGPATDQHVWTAPRAVQAALIRTPGGEAEKFLFYRGVAHIDAPIAVVQETNAGELVLRSQLPADMEKLGPLEVQTCWLVDIRPDGQVAFRRSRPVTLEENGKELTRIASGFAKRDYSPANRGILKASLEHALIKEGLFKDEAEALLNTWELSYFKSAGLRVFFLVPRAWTDFYLPLKVSVPAEITRVMVGRIELVTLAQREKLKQIAGFSASKIDADQNSLREKFYSKIENRPGEELGSVNSGRESLGDFGVSIPKSYQLYLGLGRFRNALILDAARHQPGEGLDHFILSYRLEGYKPVEISAANP